MTRLAIRPCPVDEFTDRIDLDEAQRRARRLRGHVAFHAFGVIGVGHEAEFRPNVEARPVDDAPFPDAELTDDVVAVVVQVHGDEPEQAFLSVTAVTLDAAVDMWQQTRATWRSPFTLTRSEAGVWRWALT